MKKIVFVVWSPYHRRSELLAQHFGASIHYVYKGRMSRLPLTPVRYLIQAQETWRILQREQPDVIFVQNPPIFAALVVSLYARWSGGQYIVDSHTGAFLSSKWRWSVGLHQILSRGALTTIVHNKSQEKIVKNWGCSNFVLAFTPGNYPIGEHYPLSLNFNIAVPCSFEADEPLEIVFQAATRLQEVCFYVTGDFRRLDKEMLSRKPENVCLTGYLSYERYVGLLRGVHAILDLVNTDHTMLMGGFEAVSLGIPLIISDWPTLRDYFSLGTVHIPNSIEGVCEGVNRVQRQHTQLRDDIQLLQEQLQAEWIQKFTELQHLLRG